MASYIPQVSAAANHPLDDYFDHLLAADGEVTDQGVNWDALLRSAVSPHHLEEALASSTLKSGYAPIPLRPLGQGGESCTAYAAFYGTRIDTTFTRIFAAALYAGGVPSCCCGGCPQWLM